MLPRRPREIMPAAEQGPQRSTALCVTTCPCCSSTRAIVRSTGSAIHASWSASSEKFLACGLLCHGFVRVRCDSCAEERLVASSCKTRGFCASCTSRRMAETAAHLVDRVLPAVPYRQWVLSLPRQVRFLLARDADLLGEVVGVFLRKVFAWQRRRARADDIADPHRGALT